MDRNIIIFLDIDGTLLNLNYKNNEPKLPSLISDMQSQGVTFCLNSNRSLEDMIPVAREFNVEGPLICENGMYVYEQGSEKLIVPQKAANRAIKSKHENESAVAQVLKDMYPHNPIFWENLDTVQLKTARIKKVYPDRSIIIFNNKYRRYTMSSHIKYYQNEKLKDATGIAKLVLNKLKQNQGYTKDSNFAYSEKFANILAYPDFTSKRVGLLKLVENSSKNYETYSIGDEMADYDMVSGLGTFFTTENADTKVKAIAVKTATSAYASGLYELLRRIRRQYDVK